jgi:hypothetical protein
LDPKVPLSTTRYPFGYLVLQRNSATMAKSRRDTFLGVVQPAALRLWLRHFVNTV